MSLTLNFKSLGNPHHPCVVLIHGLFGSLENLFSIGRSLQNDYHVLAVDLPDHGLSARTDAFSFTQYAQAILDLLEQLSIPSASVLGHSLGGKVAMQMASLATNKVERLIIADISPVDYLPRHQGVLAGLKAVTLNKLQDRRQADQQMAAHIQEPSVRQFLLKSLSKEQEQWHWRFNLRLLDRDYGLLIKAPQLIPYTGSTLFIKGGLSDYITLEHRPTIQGYFPNSQAKIINGTGHWLHAEKPHIFNRIVQQYLHNALHPS